MSLARRGKIRPRAEFLVPVIEPELSEAGWALGSPKVTETVCLGTGTPFKVFVSQQRGGRFWLINDMLARLNVLFSDLGSKGTFAGGALGVVTVGIFFTFCTQVLH